MWKQTSKVLSLVADDVSFPSDSSALKAGCDYLTSSLIKACCVFLHSIALIWPSEWQMIQKLFVVDHVIKITRTEVEDANPSETQYISEPSKFSCCFWFA